MKQEAHELQPWVVHVYLDDLGFEPNTIYCSDCEHDEKE
jgi:hypothetical protein